MKDKKEIRVIELFAGVGCQRMAMRNILHSTVGICERDVPCIKSYNAIHGETPNFGDIRKVEELPSADLWIFSSPCQSISLSGKQSGFSEGTGTKSSLLWEVKRLLVVAKEKGTLPKHLLMENVKNIISKKMFPEFNRFCEFLESLGYVNSYKVLNAKDFGVAQNRERLFMVSELNGDKFEFPTGSGCTKTLADYLESNVDEKYFMKKSVLDKIMFVNKRYIQYNTSPKIQKSQANRIYFEDTYSFTLSSTGTKCGGKITTTINEMTTNAEFWKKFRKILSDNVFIDLSKLDHQSKNDINVVGADYVNGKIQQTSRIRGVNGISGTIPASAVSDNTKIAYLEDDLNFMKEIEDNIVFRHLTPKEAWRLMGWDDESFEKAKNAGVSEYQLYKQAGNGIVIDVLEAIFNKLYNN